MHKGVHPLYSRPNKLTSPRPKLRQFLRFYKTVHRTILQKEKPTHDRFTLNTSVSSSDLNVHIQLWQITDNLQMDKQKRPTM